MDIVSTVIKTISKGDAVKYISLFDSTNQKEMNEYVEAYGIDGFFQGKDIKLLDIKVLSYKTGILAVGVTEDELERYGYYTKEQITAKPFADRVEDGIQSRA